MKKVFNYFFYIISIFIVLISILLSTIGIETDKFNNLISTQISKSSSDIDLKLNYVKFK